MSISLSQFSEVELKIGTIIEVLDIEGRDRLYKLMVDLAEEKPRTILAGIKPWYSKDDLSGRFVVVVSNLESKKIGDLISEGMLLCAEREDGGCELLGVDGLVKPGAKVR